MNPGGQTVVFRFEQNNQNLRRYLNTAERARVTNWQPANTTWNIELHPGHLTGEPFYIRLDGNTDNQNVPKVDTLNHNANEYANMGAIANYQKLRRGLTETQIEALLLFIRTNWAHLQLIAHRYAGGQLAPPDPLPPTARAQTKPCTTPNCAGVVQNVLSGKAPCSVCYKFQ